MYLDSILQFISLHHTGAYITLFLGSYFESLIGTSFIVFGEIFFISGAVAAGMGSLSIWMVALMLYAGGIAGDHSSYVIGRVWGDAFYQRFKKIRPFSYFMKDSFYTKASAFFEEFGGWSVLFARFLGPAAWVTPFLAGTFKLPYRRFVVFDIPAVILGIGQFIFIGYVFGKKYTIILVLLQRYTLIVVFLSIIALLLYYHLRQKLEKEDDTVGHWIWHRLILMCDRRPNFLRSNTIRDSSMIAIVFVSFYAIVLLGVFLFAYKELNNTTPIPIVHAVTQQQ